MNTLTVGSLFAGIGGFDLGFQRAGFCISWQVEIDQWCRRVLEKHFPEAKRYGDIRECGAHNLEPVDVICGGFPCQPFSAAGQRGGAEDDRYLWPEMLRVISDLRPSWVVAENVYGLTVGEMEPVFEQVLSDLESEGYDVQPFIIPACAVDAPHRRDRVWIVAHADKPGLEKREGIGGNARQECQAAERSRRPLPDAESEQVGSAGQSRQSTRRYAEWQPEPGICRVANGIPRRMERIRGLGNAVVPQIPELIGRMILDTQRTAGRVAA